MTASTKIPELLPSTAPLDDAGAAKAVVERGALLVGEFTAERSLPALDALLQAAESEPSQASLAELRANADDICRQTQTLLRETGRFLAQMPRTER
ncbi:MAG: hypothetical protein OEM59_12615 [Rhodospirillales bacterium]|nr:hypothetical protein [Rhodospirillales bacterium]